MLEFSTMAQDFVEATSSLVGGRTINIMDTEGIIIASTERERIGTFHQGAAEVIATGKAVTIEKEDLPRYQGAKEGCNMPIFLEDQLVGVVGIFGCESEVRDVANLLRVYVAQHFAQQAMVQKQNTENEIRNQLLRLILLGDREQIETIEQLAGLISFKPIYPVQVILMRCPLSHDPGSQVDAFSKLIQQLLWKQILDRRRDIFGIRDGDYVIIRSLEGRRDLKELTDLAVSETGWKLAAGSPCGELSQIPESIREVCVLLDSCSKKVCSMEVPADRIHYLMYKSLVHGGARHAEALYQKLLKERDEAWIEQALITGLVYFDEGASPSKAGERLHIHKNTLLYRMKCFYAILGIEEESFFVKEYFVRLLVLYHPVLPPE